jgi:hypothetical protein
MNNHATKMSSHSLLIFYLLLDENIQFIRVECTKCSHTHGVILFLLRNEILPCSNYAMTCGYLAVLKKRLTRNWPSVLLTDCSNSISRTVNET